MGVTSEQVNSVH